MKFKDLFVPRWQHSNPEVRTKAVKRISDAKLLKQIADNDDDAMVRETALSCLKEFEAQQVKVSEQE